MKNMYKAALAAPLAALSATALLLSPLSASAASPKATPTATKTGSITTTLHTSHPANVSCKVVNHALRVSLSKKHTLVIPSYTTPGAYTHARITSTKHPRLSRSLPHAVVTTTASGGSVSFTGPRRSGQLQWTCST